MTKDQNVILCPVRSGLTETRQAISSFFAQDIGNVAVMVVDNTDYNSPLFHYLIATESICAKPLTRIASLQPRSVAESWNVGLRWVFDAAKRPYALVVNNDVVLRQDTYRHLVSTGMGFVTAVSVDDQTKLGEPTANLPEAEMRQHPDFSCFLIRREVWQEVGEFDEQFKVAYCEDSDYHVRMAKAGVWAGCVDVPFLHLGAQTLKNADEKEARAIRREADRNREKFKAKWGWVVGSGEYEKATTVKEAS